MWLRSGRILAIVVVVLAVGVLLPGCGSDDAVDIAPPPPGSEEPATDVGNGDGSGTGDETEPGADAARGLVETKCSRCHALEQVWAADYDRERWEATVARMEANGLQVSAEERATIIEYLVEN